MNALPNADFPQRIVLLHKTLGRLGENNYLLSPIYWEYGSHIEIGSDCFVTARAVPR